MIPDWNLVRLMLLDVGRGDEELSMVIGAGHSAEVVIQHIRFCQESGLLKIPEEPEEGSFEPGFTEQVRVTVKGWAWLEATGAQQTERS